MEAWRTRRRSLGIVSVLGIALLACVAPSVPSPATVAPTAVVVATPVPTRPLRVAVLVGSPTPTLVATDYVTLARPSLVAIRDGLTRLEAQLAAAQKAPAIMAQDDWRSQMESILQDLLVADGDLRTASARVPPPATLGDMPKLEDDVEFVATEFHMALDYDPDSTHMIRAARAEKTTSAEVDNVIKALH